MNSFAYLDSVAERTPRLTPDKIQNEPAVELCRLILLGIRDESERIVRSPYPDGVMMMLDIFSSAFYQGISMGKGDLARKDFVSRLPKEALVYCS